MQSPVPPAAAAASSSTDDDFEVEGPQWDAKKVQYGLPAGARNTYDIDNMEKMNPDEYQAALRQVVMARTIIVSHISTCVLLGVDRSRKTFAKHWLYTLRALFYFDVMV